MLRVTKCDRMAKLIIDSVDDDHYLWADLLLKRCAVRCDIPDTGRYSIIQSGKPTDPVSALEFAVDLHATAVIAASNYQRCITALWRGYCNVQYYDDDRLIFGEYGYLTSRKFSDLFDTQRIKGSSPPGSTEMGEQLMGSPAISKSVEFVLCGTVFGVVYDCYEYPESERGV